VLKEIQAMYKKEGKAPPATMKSTVYYNRGVQQAAIWVEAIKNALKVSHGQKPTPTDVKQGFEMIKDFTLGGINAPLTITPRDHEGGGWVKIFRVKDDHFEQATDWFRAYRDLVVGKEQKTAEQMAVKSN
jgi:branched-chain amino acid transport system substrate-binding protein